jgi:Abortive infection alpha
MIDEPAPGNSSGPSASQSRRAGGQGRELRDSAPGMLRIAATAWRNTAQWTVGTSVRTGSRMLRATLSGESPAELLRDAGAEIRAVGERVFGYDESERDGAGAKPDLVDEDVSLRERGAELLRRSADVDYSQDTHPAYERILGELAPDEGRILRLLAEQGPQAAVDVRSGMLPIEIGTQLLALGLSMIGAEAGCRYPDRVHAYLNNLNRLGLVWFSREALRDPTSYQVLEAQPEVAEAMAKARRSHTVRRSIHLTPFGDDFCEMCLPAPGGLARGRTVL